MTNRKRPLGLLFSAIGAGMLATPLSVFSQGTLEEVIVTAQKRDEAQQDVPITITALTADKLERSNFTSVNDLPALVPALRIDNAGAFSQPTVRGVGSSTAGVGFSSNVATYVDGFYVPSQATTNMQLANLRNVEVLKGPQGTLFGRNATGGAILLTMLDPTFETTGEVRASYGSFDRTNFTGYVASGLSETVAADISGYWERSDGWVDNIYTGSDDDAELNRRGARMAVLWEAGDAGTVEFAVDHHDWDDNQPNTMAVYEGMATAAGIPGAIFTSDPEEVANDGETEFSAQITGAYLTGRFDIGEMELVSYTMVREENSKSILDLDSSSFRLFHNYFNIDNDSFSQEFNLSGLALDDRLDWVLGLYYLQVKEDYTSLGVSSMGLDVVPGFIPGGFTELYNVGTEIETVAVFADTTYELSDDWLLTLGLRYSQEKADGIINARDVLPALGGPSGRTEFDDNWSSVTPRVVVAYTPTVDSKIYLSASKGFKAGQVSPSSLAPITVEPEEIWAYELGYKLSQPSYRLSAALFYYDYTDMQVASYAGIAALVSNAASSEVYGAEGELSVAVSDALTVNVGAAYVHGEYEDYPNAPYFQPVVVGGLTQFVDAGIDASGFDMQRSPEFTGNIGILFEQPIATGTLRLNANYYYTTSFFFDPGNQFGQDAYGLLNIGATWLDPSERWSVTLYGKNVLDEEYYSQVLPGPYAHQATYGAPANYGVTVGYEF